MKLGNSLFINRTQLARELGVSVATVRNWAKFKAFPPSLEKSGKIPIYRSSEIISWLEMGGKRR